MLSYQHEYHAGNHADVLKHVCLVSLLRSLCKKEKPFTLIDSHAGAGRFHLDDERQLKTGEADTGIVPLDAYCAAHPQHVPSCIADYLACERPYLAQRLYAGSVELERLHLRTGDHLFVIERHPQAAAALTTTLELPLITMEGERRSFGKTMMRQDDSWRQLAALTPPLVKRGLVLCDPSYEDMSDYAQVAEYLSLVHKKWPTAIIALWYPLLRHKKNETTQMLFALEQCAKLGTQPVESVRCEVAVAEPEALNPEHGGLYGSGMFIMNPPWKLRETMAEAQSFLHGTLCR